MITFYIPKDISEVDAAALSNLAGFYQWQGTPYKVVKIGEKMTRKYKPFKWPPTWAHVEPKVKKHYRHEVTVASSENADYAYTLYFTSEKKARSFMNAAKESTNDVLVEYERKELPTFNEERIET